MGNMEWAIEGELARGCRPGYPDKCEITQDTVDDWINEARNICIKSIICFLDKDQLCYYDALPSGLINYYQNMGFEVNHIPVKDYKCPPLSEEEKKKTIKAYNELPKPVLVHCSAGCDRTGAAVECIKKHLSNNRR